jgi:hypothetical protein
MVYIFKNEEKGMVFSLHVLHLYCFWYTASNVIPADTQHIVLIATKHFRFP